MYNVKIVVISSGKKYRKRFYSMARKAVCPYYDYRKKISNPFQLNQLQILCDQWGLGISDVCWRLITEGITREKNKREEIEELKRQGRN